MKMTSTIKVGNDADLGVSEIVIESTCGGFVTLRIPAQVAGKSIELDVGDLHSFLSRTIPCFDTTFRIGMPPNI